MCSYSDSNSTLQVVAVKSSRAPGIFAPPKAPFRAMLANSWAAGYDTSSATVTTTWEEGGFS